jgi:hypothetical protein
MRVRSLLFILGLSCAIQMVPTASASTFRPVPLSRLAEGSDVIVVATPIASTCRWAKIGRNEHLVTDVTVEVHWTMRGPEATGSELRVRTLGGTMDGLGHLVYGEAKLMIGQASLMFLKRGRDGELHVFGMAQGHYPVVVDESGDWRVAPSPGLDGVAHAEQSATALLAGRRLIEISQLVQTGTVQP